MKKNYFAEMYFLRANAKQFLEQARFSMQRGYYNLVLFNVEQSVQLNLKYLIYLLAGEFPKTHKITELFRLVRELGDPCNLYTFYDNNKDLVAIVEYSYISSRYLPQTFTREDAERALRLGDDFDRIVEECERVMRSY